MNDRLHARVIQMPQLDLVRLVIVKGDFPQTFIDLEPEDADAIAEGLKNAAAILRARGREAVH